MCTSIAQVHLLAGCMVSLQAGQAHISYIWIIKGKTDVLPFMFKEILTRIYLLYILFIDKFVNIIITYIQAVLNWLEDIFLLFYGFLSHMYA